MNGRNEIYTKFWSETLWGRNQSEVLDTDGKAALKCILEKYGVNHGTIVNYFRKGSNSTFMHTIMNLQAP
jgi:hypothetical protein